MKLINRKGKVINSTEKAYNIVYKKLGFRKLDKNDLTKSTERKEREESHTITLESDEASEIKDNLGLKTNQELKAILDTYNIEYTTRMTKDELIDLIIKNME